MAQKALTIYTPADADPHISADDDAQMYRAVFGGSGITQADEQLAVEAYGANNIRMKSGIFCNQGYLLCIPGGDVLDLPIAPATGGYYRKDLIVADFMRGNGSVADSHVFTVVRGQEALTNDTALPPTLTQEDLTSGGSRRQEPLYRVTVYGSEVSYILQVANYVGAYYV